MRSGEILKKLPAITEAIGTVRLGTKPNSLPSQEEFKGMLQRLERRGVSAETILWRKERFEEDQIGSVVDNLFQQKGVRFFEPETDTYDKPEAQMQTDIDQLQEFRQSLNIGVGDYCSAGTLQYLKENELKWFDHSFEALARLSQDSQAKKTRKEKRTIAKEVKLFSRYMVSDLSSQHRKLSEEQVAALRTLSPLLPLFSRTRPNKRV